MRRLPIPLRADDQRLGLDLDLPAGIEQPGDDDHRRRRADGRNSRPCSALTAATADGSVRYILVRTTVVRSAPASTSASPMISKQRRACAPGSSGQEPSGQTGPVPDTSTRSSTQTAREKPMVGSNGEPEAMFWRCRTTRVSQASAPSGPRRARWRRGAGPGWRTHARRGAGWRAHVPAASDVTTPSPPRRTSASRLPGSTPLRGSGAAPLAHSWSHIAR